MTKKKLPKYIYCPFYNKNIDIWVCFDISMVAERVAPERTIPDYVKKIHDYRQKCLACPKHRYD